MQYVKIKNLEHLKNILNNSEDGQEFFISFGCARSSKRLCSDGSNRVWVLNYIDDSEQELTYKQLMNEKYTNIGKAIKAGRFYLEN